MPSGTEDDMKTCSRIGHVLNATEERCRKSRLFSVTFYETIFYGATTPSGAWSPRYRGFAITLGRTSLDE